MSRARHLGYRRNKHSTHPNRSLVKIEGVDNTEAAKYVYHAYIYIRSLSDWPVDIHSFYLGKKIAFIQKAPKEISMLPFFEVFG